MLSRDGGRGGAARVARTLQRGERGGGPLTPTPYPLTLAPNPYPLPLPPNQVSEEAVLGAMRCLGVPDEAQASAVDARQELDLKVGEGEGWGY